MALKASDKEQRRWVADLKKRVKEQDETIVVLHSSLDAMQSQLEQRGQEVPSPPLHPLQCTFYTTSNKSHPTRTLSHYMHQAHVGRSDAMAFSFQVCLASVKASKKTYRDDADAVKAALAGFQSCLSDAMTGLAVAVQSHRQQQDRQQADTDGTIERDRLRRELIDSAEHFATADGEQQSRLKSAETKARGFEQQLAQAHKTQAGSQAALEAARESARTAAADGHAGDTSILAETEAALLEAEKKSGIAEDATAKAHARCTEAEALGEIAARRCKEAEQVPRANASRQHLYTLPSDLIYSNW